MSLFEPNSMTLLVLFLLAAAGALVLLVRFGHLALRLLAGGLAIVLSAGAGMAAVNDYYGYYQTWSQLAADVSGSYSTFATTPTGNRALAPSISGQLRSEVFRGARSGINRAGLVYLPPQYFEPRFAHTTFPVLELLHGTPGRPTDWVVHLRIVQVLDRLIARHRIGPMIVVLPTMSAGHPFQECVDGPAGRDDTYITSDVRTDVQAHFRASRVPAEWGIAGYSSGGYCAANLALRHPAAFGASGIMDGYYRPTDGPAAAALNNNPAAERANDPLLAARRLGTGVRALPSFWVAAGTGNAADLAAARAFTTALHGVEQVTLYRQPGAAHNLYAWSAAAPHLLQWFWTQLAPPALRVQFPVTGPVTQGDIATPNFPVHARHRGRHRAQVVARGRP